VIEPNITNVAVDGTFDDCQDLVKAMFADTAFREEMRLSAVNSINWARIAAQIPYYAASALALGAPDVPVAFSVPTGNFGNVLAAYAASRMGLPVTRLVVASNRNDILTRFLTENNMSVAPVHPSLSPSMDIQVSSNFERLLFELLGRDPGATARTMTTFRASGRMTVAEGPWQQVRQMFDGFCLDDPGTLNEMRRLYQECGYMADPHTAIGIAAARVFPHVPIVAMGTAHPAKFPDAVIKATGVHPPLPPHLADLYDKAECFISASADLAAIEATVRATVLRNAA
jgi:threonine synthase